MPPKSASERNHFPIYDATKWAAHYTLWALFQHVELSGTEHVEADKPYIISCTHCNMIIDPGLIMDYLPHSRRAHIWAKSTLFAHPVGFLVFNGLGAVSVDRTNKQNSTLFLDTVKALQRDRAILVFPEGTSYTKPDMLPVKDGMSHALFAYEQTRRGLGKEAAEKSEQRDGVRTRWNEAAILPIAIAYTDKKAWRSRVMITFGEPVRLNDSQLLDYDKDPKAAAKEVSDIVVRRMKEGHVTASSWDAINMAKLCWDVLSHTFNIPFRDYVQVNRRVIDVLESETIKSSDHQASVTSLQVYNTTLRASNLTDTQVNFASHQRNNVDMTKQLCYWIFLYVAVSPLFLYHIPFHAVTGIVNSREVYTECLMQNRGVIVLFGAPIIFLVYTIFCWIYLGSTITFCCLPLLWFGMSWLYLRLIDELFAQDERMVGLIRWSLFLPPKTRSLLISQRKSILEEWKFILSDL